MNDMHTLPVNNKDKSNTYTILAFRPRTIQYLHKIGIPIKEQCNICQIPHAAHRCWPLCGLRLFTHENGNAPTYLISGIIMNQHRYSTRARELSCVIPRVKSSGLTSFMYQGVCHWNKLPLEIKQCPSKDTFKYQVKCLLYNRLLAQETSLYVRS